jgi:hypothetical protein
MEQRMKVIIAGSRTITDYDLLLRVVSASAFKITEVVSGGAKGVDWLGMRYAQERNLPVKAFLADWQKWGESAGPRRNEEMAQYGEALIAVWNGISKGTLNMLGCAERAKLPIFCVTVNKTYRDLPSEGLINPFITGILVSQTDSSTIRQIIEEYQREISRLQQIIHERGQKAKQYYLRKDETDG